MRFGTLAFVTLTAFGCAKKESPAPNTSSSAPAATTDEKKPFKELSLEEVEKKINQKDGKTFVFDANPEEVFQKHHLPGAVYVPDEGVTASLLPKDKSASLIFYCASPHWTASHTAAVAAAKLGYADVYVMPDGIKGWVKAGKKTEP